MSSKGKKKGGSTIKEQRQLLIKDDEHNYGTVMKKLGGSKFSLKMNLVEKEVIGRLCGKFKYKSNKKRNWVDIGTLVLVGLRDFQDNIVDIVHVYDNNEVRQLRKMGEIIEENSTCTDVDLEENSMGGDDTGFDFNNI